MKLKTHMRVFIRLMSQIISREKCLRFPKEELLEKMNKEIGDKRRTINKQHLAKIIRNQNEYNYEIRRKTYEFEEKNK